MIVQAQGNGYNGGYEARLGSGGWCFIQKDGSFLTPGIGRAMHYATPEELLAAVQQFSGAKLKRL